MSPPSSSTLKEPVAAVRAGVSFYKNMSNGVDKKKAILQGSKVKAVKKNFRPEMEAYAHRLILPGEGDVALSPSYSPMRMAAIRDRIVLDLNSHLDDNNEFYVEVSPTLVNTVNVTANTGSTSNTVSWMTDLHFHPTQSGVASEMVNGRIQKEGTSQQVRASFEEGAMCFELLSSASPSVWNLSATLTAPHMTAGTLEAFGLVGSVWSSISTATNFPFGVNTTMVLNIAANTLAISYKWTPAGDFCDCRFHGSMFYTSGGTLATTNDILTLRGYDTDLAKNVNDFVRYRVVAQDLLLTFMGADFSNGGVVASARVGRDWRAEAADVYQEISLVPVDSYNGPIKHGTHVHWIPGSIEDCSPIRPGELSEYQYKLVAAGRLDIPTQSLRLYVNTIVEFYSYEPLYGSMLWCPPAVDVEIIQRIVAACVPAATSNNKHLVKKIGNLLKHALGAGIEHALNNPDQIMKALAMFA